MLASPRWSVVSFVLAAAGACSGPGGGPPDLPPGWQPSAVVGDAVDGGFAPALATAANGDIYLVFYGEDNAWARRWVAATATWDPLVSLDGATGYAANPVIAVDDAGDAVVTWWSRHQQPIRVARFDASAGWPAGWSTGDAVAAVAGATLQPYAIALAGDGSAALTWVQVVESTRTVHAAVLEAGHGWTAPVQLSGGGHAEVPAIDLARVGDELRVYAIWHQGAGVMGDRLAHSTVTHTGTWDGATRLDDGSAELALPRGFGVTDAGQAVAIFEQRDRFANDAVVAAVRHAGTWTAPEVLSTAPSGNGTDADLSVDRDGGAFASWRECVGSTCNLMARRLAGGTWQPAQAVAAVNSGGQIAGSGDHALVVWSDRDPNGGWESMWGASFDGAAWSAPLRLESEDMVDHGTAFDVTLRRGQAGLAAWVRGAGEPPHLMRSIGGALFVDP